MYKNKLHNIYIRWRKYAFIFYLHLMWQCYFIRTLVIQNRRIKYEYSEQVNRWVYCVALKVCSQTLLSRLNCIVFVHLHIKIILSSRKIGKMKLKTLNESHKIRRKQKEKFTRKWYISYSYLYAKFKIYV